MLDLDHLYGHVISEKMEAMTRRSLERELYNFSLSPIDTFVS